MNKKIISLFVFASFLCLASFALAVDCPPGKICNPLNVNTFGALLTKIAEKVGELIAVLGTIMLIVAGILYLTSAGSPERIGTAKKALVYAIVGIVIGIAASAIVKIIKDIIGAPA